GRGGGDGERVATDFPQLALDELAARAEAMEVLDGVDLVARGHRRVGGEDDPLAQLRPCRVEIGSRLDAVGDELAAREDRVSLVEVIDLHRQVEGAEAPA